MHVQKPEAKVKIDLSRWEKGQISGKETENIIRDHLSALGCLEINLLILWLASF